MRGFLARVAATRLEEQLEAARCRLDAGEGSTKRLTAEQCRRLVGLRAAGLSLPQCAAALGVSVATLKRALREGV